MKHPINHIMLSSGNSLIKTNEEEVPNAAVMINSTISIFSVLQAKSENPSLNVRENGSVVIYYRMYLISHNSSAIGNR